MIYRYESLVSIHANLTTIGGHLIYGDGQWAVSVDSSQTQDDVAVLSKNPIDAVRRADSTLDARRVATFVPAESLC